MATGQVALHQFELTVDGKRVSGLDSADGVKSPYIPRILLALLEYTAKSTPRFAKKDERWRKLGDLLRKAYRQGQKPEWFKAVFQDGDLGLLFQDVNEGGNKGSKYLCIDATRFPPHSIQVSIKDATAGINVLPQDAITALEKASLRDTPSNHWSDLLHDKEFARRMASELEVPNIGDEDKLLLGKAIWLSRLVLFSKLIETNLLSDNGYLSRLKNILQPKEETESDGAQAEYLEPEDMNNWKVRLDAYQRLIMSNFLRQPAEKVGFDFRDLKSGIDRLLLDASKYANEQIDRDEFWKRAQHAEEPFARAVAALHEKIAECRECFRQLWEK
jgi:hypothetical protein